MLIRMNMVEHPKPVVRAEAKLPLRPEGYRPLQQLPVAGFHFRFEAQLALNFRLDQRMVLGFDGPQMLLHLIGVH